MSSQRRTAAEHEAEIAGVDRHDRGQCLDDIPILLDKRRRGQPKVFLDFEQLFERGLIAQAPVPYCDSGDVARSDSSPALPD